MHKIVTEELIGKKTRIKTSTMPEIVGKEGTVINETMKTITIKTKEKELIIPKKECTFEFEYHGKWVTVRGKDLAFRPEERIKKHWRNMHGKMRR